MNPKWKKAVNSFKEAWLNKYGYAVWDKSFGGAAVHPFTQRMFFWCRNRKTGELIWSRKPGGIGRK